MYGKSFQNIFALTCLLSLFSCAPALNEKLSLTKIPESRIAALQGVQVGTVRVEEFDDARPNSWVGRVHDGRTIEPNGKVGTQVQMAFERRLRMHSVPLTNFEGTTLTGEVRQWMVDVAVHFPASRIHSSAELEVSVLDRKGRLLFSGVYRGDVEEERPFIEDRVEEILGQAMGMAISEALGDRALLAALRAAGAGLSAS